MNNGIVEIDSDYTPDGKKLSCRHSTMDSNGVELSAILDRYVDGLTLRYGVPYRWQFEGGYVDLDSNGAPTSWNYY